MTLFAGKGTLPGHALTEAMSSRRLLLLLATCSLVSALALAGSIVGPSLEGRSAPPSPAAVAVAAFSSTAGGPTLASVSGLPVLPGWSMYHGDPTLSGVAAGSLPLHPHVLWTLDLPVDGASLPGTSYHPFQSSAVLDHGSVIIPTADTLYQVNSTTGVVEHAFSLIGAFGDGPYIATPTALPYGLVGLTLGGGSGDSGVFNLSTGAFAFAPCPFNGDAVASSLAPIPGGLLEADTSGHVNAIDLQTLSCTSPGYNGAPGGPHYRSTPSVIFVNGAWQAYLPDYGSGNIDNYAVPQGGNSATITLPGSNALFGSMAVANVTNGSQEYALGFVGDSPGAGAAAQLYAVNLSGAAAFANVLTYPASTHYAVGVEGTPIVVDQGNAQAAVIVGNDSGNLTAYDFSASTGGWFTQLWNFQAPGTGVRFAASPVLAGGLVVDGATNGGVYCVNAMTGGLVWALSVGAPVYATPAVSGGVVYIFTAAGVLEAISLAPPTVAILPPSPAPTSGSRGMVEVFARGVAPDGSPGGGLNGASVDLTVNGGAVVAPDPASTDLAGYAYFNWSTPSGTTSTTNYTLSAEVAAPTYAVGFANATAEVLGSAPPPPPLLMAATVSAHPSTLVEGGTSTISVSLEQPGGAVIAGGAVVLSLVGPGTLSAYAGVTGSNGVLQVVYTAPTGLGSDTPVLLEANVSDPGFLGVENATALEVTVPGTSPSPALSASVAPFGNLTVPAGGLAPLEVIVASSSGPVAGATATATAVPDTLGGFVASPTSKVSSAAGILYYNFSALEGTGSVLGLFQVSATGYTSAAVSVAVAVLPTGSLSGSLEVSATAATPGPYWSGSTVAVDVAGSLLATDGVTSPAVGVTVGATVEAPTGYDGLSASSVVLSDQGEGSLSVALPLLDRPTLLLVLFSGGETGYGSSSATLVLLVEPRPLSLSTSLSSSTLAPGTSGTLTVDVAWPGISAPFPTTWANVSVGSSSTGTVVVGPPSSMEVSNAGVASLSVHVSGSVGQFVVLDVQAGAAGYAATGANVTISLVSSTGSSGSGGLAGFSSLDLLLLALLLLFVVLFLVALFTRRRSGAPIPGEAPPPVGGTSPLSAPFPPPVAEYEETHEGPPMHAPPADEEVGPGPPPPPTESAPATSSPDHWEVAYPGPPAEATSGEFSALGSEEEPPSAEPTATAQEGEAPEGAGMHVEMERTLGEERPSVEEANPYAGHLQPEDVNPNIHRIPKKLLQPAEMRIQHDEEGAGGPAPPSEADEHEARAQELLEKWKKARQVEEQEPSGDPPPPPPPAEGSGGD